MDCIFCKIISGEIPSFRVAENETHLAFLSIAPIKAGHTLVIPKKHSDYIFDLENSEIADLMVFSKSVSSKLKETLNPKTGKIGVMVAGLQVPHTHIHLIPMDSEGDLTFANAKSASNEELTDILELIKR